MLVSEFIFHSQALRAEADAAKDRSEALKDKNKELEGKIDEVHLIDLTLSCFDLINHSLRMKMPIWEEN